MTPNEAHQCNLDAAQREMDARAAEGEDMTGATICRLTYAIVKPAAPATPIDHLLRDGVKARLHEGLATVSRCTADGHVTKVELQDAREGITRAIDDAFSQAKGQVGDAAPEHRSAYSYGLISMAVSHRELAAGHGLPDDWVATLKFAADMLPLLNSAKLHAKAGRRPSEKAKPGTPRVLDMGTCAWCGRLQSVRHGRMVDHGYTEKHGWRSGICGGITFAPLEVSVDGLVGLRAAITNRVGVIHQALANPPRKLTLTSRRGAAALESIGPGHPEYALMLRQRDAKLKREAESLGQELERLAPRIEAWAPAQLITAAEATRRGL